MAKATLLVIQGADLGARFEIGEGEVHVGRGVGNEIRILDTEISRNHATLRYENGAFVITDCDSSNGTFVNGVAVRSRRLNSGDQIQMGRSAVSISVGVDVDLSRVVAAENVSIFSADEIGDASHIVNEIGQETRTDLLREPLDPASPGIVQTLANLQALYRIAEVTVTPSLLLDALLQRILDLTIEVVHADRGCMLITDPQTGNLVPAAYSHLQESESGTRMPVSQSIVDYVLRNGQGVRTSDARSDRRFEAGKSILQAGIREAMCVPMQGRYELMGVIYVDTTTSAEQVLLKGGMVDKFSEEQLRLLVAIGRQSALAIEDHRYQHAFVKAERLAAVGQTIATLSHHIKNILQGVRGGSYLIDMGLKQHDEELIQKGWAIVEKNQNKIYDLVMDMLSYSTERQPALEQGSLNDTVRDVCELMQSRADDGQVELQCELAETLPQSTFDPEGMHRAVLNIVTNAIDAVEGRDNASVVVSTGYLESADALFVQVSDNGPGIPADQLMKIFNLFESTKGARGTGIGLAVSQKIVREHGGEISVESKPGSGSCFKLSLPKSDDEQPPINRNTSLA